MKKNKKNTSKNFRCNPLKNVPDWVFNTIIKAYYLARNNYEYFKRPIEDRQTLHEHELFFALKRYSEFNKFFTRALQDSKKFQLLVDYMDKVDKYSFDSFSSAFQLKLNRVLIHCEATTS